jgi:hypothetical protein
MRNVPIHVHFEACNQLPQLLWIQQIEGKFWGKVLGKKSERILLVSRELVLCCVYARIFRRTVHGGQFFRTSNCLMNSSSRCTR